MSIELNGGVLSLGAGGTSTQAGSVPQVVMAVDDAAAHPRKERKDETQEGSRRSGLPRSLRRVCIGVAYLCAGLTGWSLYEFASPWFAAMPGLPTFQQAQKPSDNLPPPQAQKPSDTAQPLQEQKPSDSAQLLQATQKIASQLQALQARMDAMSAAPRKEDKEATNVEELNRRIDAAKADTSAEIRQLSNTVEQLQREMTARLAEIGAVSRHAERAAAEAAAAAPPRLATAVRVEEGYKRSHKRRGDAFDPTQNPHAPGAPRPLGARAGSVP